MIRRGLKAYRIESFRDAKAITGMLERTSFTNLNSVVERIPISGWRGYMHSNGEDLGEHFTQLLVVALELAKGDADDLGEPQRSSRLSMIKEVRAALSDRGKSPTDFMNLVRITAQRSSTPLGSPSGSPRAS